MGRICPNCDGETHTETNRYEGGTVTWENCPNCPHSTYLDTTPKGSNPRTDIDIRG